MARRERRFLFKLALALGFPSVRELTTRMTSRDVAEWKAYYSIEPFGEARADLRTGILASLIANVHRDRKKRPEPFVPEDFMPGFDNEG
jgi:hypothetical protein